MRESVHSAHLIMIYAHILIFVCFNRVHNRQLAVLHWK